MSISYFRKFYALSLSLFSATYSEEISSDRNHVGLYSQQWLNILTLHIFSDVLFRMHLCVHSAALSSTSVICCVKGQGSVYYVTLCFYLCYFRF